MRSTASSCEIARAKRSVRIRLRKFRCIGARASTRFAAVCVNRRTSRALEFSSTDSQRRARAAAARHCASKSERPDSLRARSRRAARWARWRRICFRLRRRDWRRSVRPHWRIAVERRTAALQRDHGELARRSERAASILGSRWNFARAVRSAHESRCARSASERNDGPTLRAFSTSDDAFAADARCD